MAAVIASSNAMVRGRGSRRDFFVGSVHLLKEKLPCCDAVENQLQVCNLALDSGPVTVGDRLAVFYFRGHAVLVHGGGVLRQLLVEGQLLLGHCPAPQQVLPGEAGILHCLPVVLRRRRDFQQGKLQSPLVPLPLQAPCPHVVRGSAEGKLGGGQPLFPADGDGDPAGEFASQRLQREGCVHGVWLGVW